MEASGEVSEIPDGPPFSAIQRVDPYCGPVMEFLDLEELNMQSDVWADRALPNNESHSTVDVYWQIN